jgi:hypothetical protein
VDSTLLLATIRRAAELAAVVSWVGAADVSDAVPADGQSPGREAVILIDQS